MSEEVRELFKCIISMAMDNGKEIRLEWKDYNSTSKALGGSIIDSATCDNGIVLNIFQPSNTEDEA